MTTLALPDNICSPQDLTALILEIREYARWYDHETIKRRSGTVTTTTSPVLSVTTANYLRSFTKDGSTLGPNQLDELLHELETYKKTAPTITLTLAAPAPESIKKTLTNWCRRELSPNILVAFDFNRTLLGGMVVRYGSHVHDWSLRRNLMNTKQSFTEVLTHV